MSRDNKSEWELRLIGNYAFDEVASALQKMIRRGKEYEACFWAYLLHQSGFGQYLWRRLAIICSEDIGNGEPRSAILINALWNNWEKLHKHSKEPRLDKLLLAVQAILFMCRAKKSREDDSLVNLIHENWKNNNRLEIPPLALDIHCEKGRKKFGRLGDKDGKEKTRISIWFSHWSKIENKAYKDKWEKKLKRLLLKNALTLT